MPNDDEQFIAGNQPQPLPPAGQLLIYEDGTARLQVRLEGQTVWLTQRLLADLYQVSVPTVNEHLANIYGDCELDAGATIRSFRIVQTEGRRQVTRNVEHYNLDAILAVGYRVRSARGTAFRQWATAQLRDLLVKGFVLDDQRLKAGRTICSEYFDELLEQIRDIRASERLFYQKITDIYASSIDYDPTHRTSQDFFATVQNKLHWAIHGSTAAEIVRLRANASLPNMGLTAWKNAPDGPIRKSDVTVAKNYLTHGEITELNRIVTMYLDYAEDQAHRHTPMHMADWVKKIDSFLEFNERNILTHAGKVSHELAEEYAQFQFERYNAERRQLEANQSNSDFDNAIEKLAPLPTKAEEKPPAENKSSKSKSPRRRPKSGRDPERPQ